MLKENLEKKSQDNWKVQIRKGYLELCLLLIIASRKRLYGLEIIDILRDELNISIKEGTLYPMLHRMSIDGLLCSEWETQNLSGHPRKFYKMTEEGELNLESMCQEFENLTEIYFKLRQKRI